jgi:hypothetical protein
VGGGEVPGTTVGAGTVADDWVHPAINMHAITSRKRKNPEHLINNFLFAGRIRLLPVAEFP